MKEVTSVHVWTEDETETNITVRVMSSNPMAISNYLIQDMAWAHLSQAKGQGLADTMFMYPDAHVAKDGHQYTITVPKGSPIT